MATSLVTFSFLYVETGRKYLRLHVTPTKKLTLHVPPKVRNYRTSKAKYCRNSASKLDTPKIYNSLNELHTCALKLKLTGWIIDEAESNDTLSYSEPLFHVPKYQIIINNGLGFTVIVYVFSLPDSHVL